MEHCPLTMVHGPWSMDHGPLTMVHGPWSMGGLTYSELRVASEVAKDLPNGTDAAFNYVMVHGPWSIYHCPWTMVHGPWSMDHAPWTMVH